MPIAAIIAIVQGVVAGAPDAIRAFNALKDMIAGGKETITADELEALRKTAASEHAKTQDA
jgi:hypothetical protein